MKNDTFDNINISVPIESHFNINPGTNTYSGGGMSTMILITPFNSNNSTFDNVGDFWSSYIEGDNVSLTKLDGLNNNSEAFISNSVNTGYFIILVKNNEENRAIVVETGDEKLAVKMANSVVFPN
ncbi:MAG: hypothetical protein KO253_08080 [Methanobrevibacter arboriphilus]|nr:hypothetical protein [Methanobrevibacter arboriphilus]